MSESNTDAAAMLEVAEKMAASVGLVWEILPEKHDMVCGHGMPQGCRTYWYSLARVAAASRPPAQGAEWNEAIEAAAKTADSRLGVAHKLTTAEVLDRHASLANAIRALTRPLQQLVQARATERYIALVENEAKRRCVEAGVPLDTIGYSPSPSHGGVPYWKAHYVPEIEREITALVQAGFAVVPEVPEGYLS